MLPAKLFITFAILVGVFGFLYEGGARSTIDLYLHSVYLVIAPRHLQLAAALGCAMFAAIYFCSAKWLARPLNDIVGVAHFVSLALGVILVAVAVKAVSSAAVLSGSEVRIWHFLVLYAGILSLLLSCFIFVLNLVLSLVSAI